MPRICDVYEYANTTTAWQLVLHHSTKIRYLCLNRLNYACTQLPDLLRVTCILI